MMKFGMKIFNFLTIGIVIFGATASPPQLRLSQSGYEIISINEQLDEASSSRVGPKQGSSSKEEVYPPSLERSPEVEKPEEPDRGIPEARSELRHNYLEISSPEVRPNFYLTLGIPKKSRPEVQETTSGLEAKNNENKSYEAVKNNENKSYERTTGEKGYEKPWDESRSGENRKSRKNSRSGARGKFFLGKKLVPETMEASNYLRSLIVDAPRGWMFVFRQPEVEDKYERAASQKTIHKLFSKFPSVQFHNPRDFWTKGEGVYSPIYPSSFDVLAGEGAARKTPWNLSGVTSGKGHVANDAKNSLVRSRNEIPDVFDLKDTSDDIDKETPEKMVDRISKNMKVDEITMESGPGSLTMDSCCHDENCDAHRKNDESSLFYRFLEKFSVHVLDKALAYENSLPRTDEGINMEKSGKKLNIGI